MPNAVGLHPGEQYSPATGLIYVFNLIVGTGCLTLPAAFAAAGWSLSAAGILLLALVSYMTTTWVVESMACANAINHWRRMKQLKKRGQVADELVNRTLENAEADQRTTDTSEDQEDHEEDSPLITEGVIERTVGEYYAIQEQIEMGQMAALFYPKVWDKVFYVVLCIYLYGDLAIYEAAVAKSLRDSMCNYAPENCTEALLDSDRCFVDSDFTRLDIYRLCAAGFIGVMGPFVFFNLTKTKYMQIVTSFTRWLAMGIMITWAIVQLAENQGKGHPPPADVTKLPQLFGVCVYSFMCHHSLPALITPVSEKRSILKLLAADYLLILMFYYLLAFTGIFTFAHLEDLYTLNFQPDRCKTGTDSNFVYSLQVFLLMFPVFTLSTNFPIIAITLRNNLKSLCLRENRRYSFFTSRCLFPLLAIIPPTLVGLATSDVEILVGITGAYAGSFIQYVVPATLVYYARKMTLQHIGMGVKNPFSAPLQHSAWLVVICIWAALCQVFVTLYLIEEYKA
ncbi:transmembrane protein 104-like isoform X2 [Eriocheir sinensis]|uniref:transmembrane protein 104-like isoform X2 n=1 Tax=Eriocheir sinensis TaxID=95602 RepID=UPI0021C70C34|nr:transmembrane protein 104-like isoform X2 [Eriocheir sinensis]